MNWAMGIVITFNIALGVILLIPICYVLARAASLGWYKSRFEHVKRILKLQTPRSKE